MTTKPTSGAPHPNVVTYLEAIEAFNRDDLDAVQSHVRADVVYRIPGDSIGLPIRTVPYLWALAAAPAAGRGKRAGV